jgi:hypothetical protein
VLGSQRQQRNVQEALMNLLPDRRYRPAKYTAELYGEPDWRVIVEACFTTRGKKRIRKSLPAWRAWRRRFADQRTADLAWRFVKVVHWHLGWTGFGLGGILCQSPDFDPWNPEFQELAEYVACRLTGRETTPAQARWHRALHGS